MELTKPNIHKEKNYAELLSFTIYKTTQNRLKTGINYKTTEEKRLGNDFLDITLKAKLGDGYYIQLKAPAELLYRKKYAQ